MHDAPMIIPSVLEYFAADAFGPIFAVRDAAEDQDHPLRELLREQLDSFEQARIESIRADPLFLFHHTHLHSAELDAAARQWYLIELLNTAIPARRRELLISDEADRPAPYEHPALRDLPLTDEHLVPLQEFVVCRNGALVRSGFAFSLVPVTESVNASHWLTQSLAQHAQRCAYVRLDPLLVSTVERYRGCEYKMLVYGRALDWARLSSLAEEEHGRWLPGRLTRDVQSTEYVWSPRGDGVHFRCEELINRDRARSWGSRYLHGIYSPGREAFEHLDCALRFMNSGEMSCREETHLRNAGKVGVRVKMLRIDHWITQTAFADLCAQFFVWNFDVARYCGADVAPDL